jgi:arylformamidase
VNQPYRTLPKDRLEYEYSPRLSVPDHAKFVEMEAARSERTRQRLKAHRNIAYGKSPREILDIFLGPQSDAPVQIFIHGGYWRAASKDDNSYLAETFFSAGAAMVFLEYDLCPHVTLSEIVRQARAGIAWVYSHIADYGGNPKQIYLSGRSAGAHLVAMALAHDWEKQERLPRDLIKGALCISGIYDLEPVLHLTLNNEVRLTPQSARDNSPMLHPPASICPIVVAVGAKETESWIRMSADYAAMCRKQGLPCELLVVPDAHHFSICERLTDPQNPLTRAVLTQMSLRP